MHKEALPVEGSAEAHPVAEGVASTSEETLVLQTQPSPAPPPSIASDVHHTTEVTPATGNAEDMGVKEVLHGSRGMGDLESSYMEAESGQRRALLRSVQEENLPGDTLRHGGQKCIEEEEARVKHLGDNPERGGDSLWSSKTGHFHYHRDIKIPHVSDLPDLMEPKDRYFLTASEYEAGPRRDSVVEDPSDVPYSIQEQPVVPAETPGSLVHDTPHAQYQARFDYGNERIPEELGGSHCPETGGARVGSLHDVSAIEASWEAHIGAVVA